MAGEDDAFDARAYLEQQSRERATADGGTAAAPPAPPETAVADREPDAPAKPRIEDAEARDYGAKLATALRDGHYHPVILFGTAASGKTSLLVSLFATVMSDRRLQVSLERRMPELNLSRTMQQELEDEARNIFEIKTELFIRGNLPPATPVGLPFFIPVELTPSDKSKPAARIAFLESAGEAYRPNTAALSSTDPRARLYPQLRSEIETFIADFQGPISFLYLAPYTQRAVASTEPNTADSDALADAGLALRNVLKMYDQIRIDYREGDWHHLLVTKWDAHSARTVDADERASDDKEAQEAFLDHRYPQVRVDFDGLKVPAERRKINGYAAGIVNARGMLQTALHSDLKAVVQRYPEGIWTRLYCNAITAQGYAPVSPFPQPPARHPLLQTFDRVIRFISGH